MRHILLLLLLGFAVTLTSCRDDFEFQTSAGGLEFSKDTVYLDTVFSNIGSSTYTLKVYNRSNKDISIPTIQLGQGEQSKYRLMVDGVPGKIFNNVELLAKDSMFVFVETTIDYSEYANSQTTFLYTDEIQFTSSTGQQHVNLVTLVQDAVFIKPNRPLDTGIKEKLTINGLATDNYGHELSTPDELHWTNQKPYVVYGYALVPNGKTLTVDPGARVYFHAESGLIVDRTGIIKVNGATSTTTANENEVVFEGDRLEPDFADINGQWLTMLIFSGSDENSISHLTIKNATIGILMEQISIDDTTLPKVKIDNSQIYNCTNFGILARRGIINGDNLVVNNAGQASVALTFGGTYNFRQCTFANYFNAYNQVPLLINDYLESDDNSIHVTDITANFDNCIMYGSGNVGMSLEKYHVPSDSNVTTNFHLRFNHSLIKLIDFSNALDNNALYPGPTGNGNDTTLAVYDGCILATSSTKNKPKFEDAQNNKLNLIRPGTVNAASPGPEGSADPDVAAQVGPDILGHQRPYPPDTAPDIGAYESQDQPAE